MYKVDRNSCESARQALELLIPDRKIRWTILSALTDQIIYAEQVAPDNWNLNLDLTGKFLRFNIGQEWAMNIQAGKVLILGFRDEFSNNEMLIGKVNFYGYDKARNRILASSLSG